MCYDWVNDRLGLSCLTNLTIYNTISTVGFEPATDLGYNPIILENSNEPKIVEIRRAHKDAHNKFVEYATIDNYQNIS